jgi:hypothetical protein
MLFKLFKRKSSAACAGVGVVICVSLGYDIGGGWSL